MLTANTLSGAYMEDCERSPAEEEVDHIHASHFLPVSDHQLKEIQRERERHRETTCPSALQSLKNTILDGFFVAKDYLLAAIHPLQTSLKYLR